MRQERLQRYGFEVGAAGGVDAEPPELPEPDDPESLAGAVVAPLDAVAADFSDLGGASLLGFVSFSLRA